MKNKPFPILFGCAGALLISATHAIEAPADDAPPPPAADAPAAEVPAADAPAAEEAPAVEAVEETAYLGVVSNGVPPMLAEHLDLKPGEGIVVRAIMPDGPAAKAGLAENDIILKFAGEPVGTPEDLSREVAALKPGEEVRLDIIHKGKPAGIDVTLGNRPKNADLLGMPFQGMQPLDDLRLDGIRRDLAERLRGMVEGNLGELHLDGAVEIAPMNEAMLDMQKQMEKAMEGLNNPAAPRFGRFEIHQGATFRFMDEQGSVELKKNDDGKEVTIRDKDNEITWTGPWDTDQDKAAAPDDIRARIERLNFDDKFQGKGLRFNLRGMNAEE